MYSPYNRNCKKQELMVLKMFFCFWWLYLYFILSMFYEITDFFVCSSFMYNTNTKHQIMLSVIFFFQWILPLIVWNTTPKRRSCSIKHVFYYPKYCLHLWPKLAPHSIVFKYLDIFWIPHRCLKLQRKCNLGYLVSIFTEFNLQ